MSQTIVYVDDEEMNLELIKNVLGDKYDVHTFLNPNEALKKLPELNPLVIMSDQRMKEMTGVELFEKAKDICLDAARILVTGYPGEETAISAIRYAGLYDYIMKPFEPDDLNARIAKAITFSKRENFIRMSNESLIKQVDKYEKQIEALTKEKAALLKENGELKTKLVSMIK